MKESIFERLPEKKMSRKIFLKLCGVGIGSLVLNNSLFKFAFGQDDSSTGRVVKKIKGLHDLVVVIFFRLFIQVSPSLCKYSE